VVAAVVVVVVAVWAAAVAVWVVVEAGEAGCNIPVRSLS
jgi:hypothetical protein